MKIIGFVLLCIITALEVLSLVVAGDGDIWKRGTLVGVASAQVFVCWTYWLP
jgi:heme/copper-type cytochrome/quinol oxidase subunit 4